MVFRSSSISTTELFVDQWNGSMVRYVTGRWISIIDKSTSKVYRFFALKNFTYLAIYDQSVWRTLLIEVTLINPLWKLWWTLFYLQQFIELNKNLFYLFVNPCHITIWFCWWRWCCQSVMNLPLDQNYCPGQLITHLRWTNFRPSTHTHRKLASWLGLSLCNAPGIVTSEAEYIKHNGRA